MNRTYPALCLSAILAALVAVSFAWTDSAVIRLDNGTTTVNAPPRETKPLRNSELVDVTRIDGNFKLDVRYATANNFTGRAVYPEARVFLQRPAAEALARAHRRVHQQGFGMILFDGYRPWSVTKLFWDVTPAAKKEFVADPAVGSRHNRGCAIDLALCDLATSAPVPMPSGYDEMTSRSYPHYTGGSEESRRNRDVLRAAMEAEGFTVYPSEWWHFDYGDYAKYPIMNASFAELDGGSGK